MKIIRRDIVDRIESTTKDAIHRRHGETALGVYIELIKAQLLAGKAVAIKRMGKLSPSIKPGGRPVRNPKTGAEMTMPDHRTVSLSKTNTTDAPTVSLLEQIRLLSESPKMARLCGPGRYQLNSVADMKELANATVRAFHAMCLASRDHIGSIEIRDFGTIKTIETKRKTVRNPKTGEVRDLKEGEVSTRTTFREGKTFKALLNADL